jgi:4-carboxymuconolactone decarboxylase
MSQPQRFGPLPLEEMSPQQRAIADAILAGPRGSSSGLRGPFEAFLRSPGVAAPAQELGQHCRFGSSIPAALNEMAILLVARRWTAQYECGGLIASWLLWPDSMQGLPMPSPPGADLS